MNYQIVFARPDNEAQLRGILLESDMDIAGEVREHVLIKSADEIIGGGMLSQTGAGVYHLIVFAVKESARGNGIGRVLLKELLGQPWKHCLNGTGTPGGAFCVTTVAKGRSAGFYRKNGFAPCDFSALAEPFRGQCRECPEKDDCHPVALSYQGRSSAGEPARA
jgi:N-acetylglutamate synthase-like GNAT family acetyltransferase